MPAGRPTKYKTEYAERVMDYCLLGATNEELARIFEVNVSTIDKWIRDIPEFSSAVKDGREDADAKVSQSLYRTALAGNTTAQIFWLKNRRRLEWREKHEISLNVNPSEQMLEAIKRGKERAG